MAGARDRARHARGRVLRFVDRTWMCALSGCRAPHSRSQSPPRCRLCSRPLRARTRPRFRAKRPSAAPTLGRRPADSTAKCSARAALGHPRRARGELRTSPSARLRVTRGAVFSFCVFSKLQRQFFPATGGHIQNATFLAYSFCAMVDGPKKSGKLCMTKNSSSSSFPNRSHKKFQPHKLLLNSLEHQHLHIQNATPFKTFFR